MKNKSAQKLGDYSHGHGTSAGASKAGKNLGHKTPDSARSKGGEARADSMTSKERSDSAKHAANERWKK